MSGQLIIIHTDGSRVQTPWETPPTLKELQKAIGGGFIEIIPKFSFYAGHPCVAFCDEEGKIKGLKINEEASMLWEVGHDYLVGPVAILIGDRTTLATFGAKP
jgi:hypothetical protein